MTPRNALEAAWKAYRGGRRAEAESLCRQALATAPELPRALQLAGLIALQAGRLDDARSFVERAVEADLRNAELPVLLGTIHEAAGRPDPARASYLRAIELRLTHEQAQERLRQLQSRLGTSDRSLRVSVIVPTVGATTLRQAVESVLNQTHDNIELLVVADGPEAAAPVRDQLQGLPSPRNLKLLELPFNTGANGLCGHRIYAAANFLVSGHYVVYLDEDNWFEPDHIALLSDLCTSRGLEWAYALRRIVGADGAVLCNDDCESLGRWPTWHMPQFHHVDTNCYLIRRDIAARLGDTWYRRLRDGTPAPTSVCGRLLREHPHFDTSGHYTVNYRVARTQYSVSADFFRQGNEAMRRRYPQGFPWCRTGTEHAGDARPPPADRRA